MNRWIRCVLMSALCLLPVAAVAQSGGSAGKTSEKKESQAKPEVQPEPKIKVGDLAPDFKLLDQNWKPVFLSDFRGKKNVALAFYVFAFTGG